MGVWLDGEFIWGKLGEVVLSGELKRMGEQVRTRSRRGHSVSLLSFRIWHSGGG